MSSIKCPHCGLVNFSTSQHCKRCQQVLNQYEPIADQRNYQASVQNYSNYQVPPPPPVFGQNQKPPSRNSPMSCIKCGDRNKISLQNFKKSYVPPSIGAAAIAPLLYLILVSIFKVTHQINAPFCDSCWKKFNNGKMLEIIGGVVSLILVIAAIPVFTVFDSIIGFSVCFIAAIVVFAVCHSIKTSWSPKFKLVDNQKVIIEAPHVGEICFQK